MKQNIWSWIKDLLFATIFVFILNTCVVVNAKIPTGSMENTIMTNDRIIAFRLNYTFEEPKRGDIVVFKYPDDESQKFVKRIIGMPGEEIIINNKSIYIDGNLLYEPYIKEEMAQDENMIFQIPENAYFMMGDNRNDSLDSRYWENTFVYRDKFLGKVILKYFPEIEIMTDK